MAGCTGARFDNAGGAVAKAGLDSVQAGINAEKAKKEDSAVENGNPAAYKDFISEPLGFKIRVPQDMEADERYAPSCIRLRNSRFDIRISREISPYSDVHGYISQYLYKYLLDSSYRNANAITLRQDTYKTINGMKVRILTVSRKPASGSGKTGNDYLYAHFLTEKRGFYYCMIRTDSIEKHGGEIDRILNSFGTIPAKGAPRYHLQLSPELPKWNAETRGFYDRLKASEEIFWGLFYPDTITKDFSTLERIEKAVGYSFPITLHYLYLGHAFPAEGMKKAYEKGKTVELTMQVMYDVRKQGSDEQHNVNFDVLDGLYDGEIRKFAKDLKAFRHPVLFRLNNEMNSTWTKYGGIALMCDPDIFIEVWRRIYDIFQEEGVDNAIWVFNPNDRDYPPMNWNAHISYYPGDRYVQVVGLTGYNTGEYYRAVTGEKWRSFSEIYEPLCSKYEGFYSRFPWMITEFASSSVGGDKERWIEDMFRQIGRYPNIKAAVWWSYADFDYREKTKGIPARRYWLDEREEYLRAFKNGLRQNWRQPQQNKQ